MWIGNQVVLESLLNIPRLQYAIALVWLATYDIYKKLQVSYLVAWLVRWDLMGAHDRARHYRLQITEVEHTCLLASSECTLGCGDMIKQMLHGIGCL